MFKALPADADLDQVCALCNKTLGDHRNVTHECPVSGVKKGLFKVFGPGVFQPSGISLKKPGKATKGK